MSDLLLEVGVNNLLLSAAVALVAYAVHRDGRRPWVAHLLWLIVLVKLVTPPVLNVPMVAVPGLGPPAPAAEFAEEPPEAGTSGDAAALLPGDPNSGAATGASTPSLVKTSLVLVWLGGSLLVLAWSLVRVRNFHQLIRLAAAPAPAPVQRAAAELAGRLGLKRVPTVELLNANLSPMVWGIGREVRVLLPASLVRELPARELRLVLAHELAHVRRRDHLVRWLEWLACVAFWWNPVAWWARRNLRANEEICCDALVLERLNPEPRAYADSLLNAVESLALPVLRPPAMASEINSGGFLERRLRMIVSKNPIPRTPRWMSALLLCVAGVLPLGVAYAQEPDMEAVGDRLVQAVQAGELSEGQAHAMIGALAHARLAEKMEAAGDRREQRQRRAEQAEPRRLSREQMARAEAELKAAVESGEVSREDARRRLGRLQQWREGAEARGTRPETGQEATTDPLRQRRQRYRALELELEEAVEAGRIAPEDARKKLQDVRAALRGGGEGARAEARAPEAPDADPRVAKYRAYQARIRQAVEAGRMSREEAREKLEALRAELWKEGPEVEEQRPERRRGEEADPRVERYRAYEARVKAVLEAGRITEEEALRQLEEARMAMWGERDERGDAERKARDGARRDQRAVKYRAYEVKIHQAVEAGELSREEAAKKLQTVKEKLWPDDRRPD